MADTKVKKKLSPRQKSELFWGWLFVIPTLAGLIILNIWPLIQTIYQSFFKTGAFGLGNTFVGAENYTKMFATSEVLQSLLNTFKYAIIEVPFSVVIALILAVLLNRKMVGRGAYRTIFFLPMVAAPAAVAMVWRWLYNAEYGLINHVIGSKINWVSDPKIAWISLGIIGVWSVVGYNMVLFISGLQEIPGDYYEAASIDGATGIKQFFHITIPLLSPTIFFVLTTRIMGAMQVFDLIYMIMDKTNPAIEKTQSLVFLFYQYSFTYQEKGYGAAIVVFLLIVILIMTFIKDIFEKRYVHYN
ncbi:N-Acetyl-D-glucosamine ABC transport system, permease protein 1 [Lachnospiraceae bacterium TWA4]|nr:N-Acetyl-D-glucosamine ABC transport system, permease protein 1 [Lachnospiraceae bacterium TWA4]